MSCGAFHFIARTAKLSRPSLILRDAAACANRGAVAVRAAPAAATDFKNARRLVGRRFGFMLSWDGAATARVAKFFLNRARPGRAAPGGSFFFHLNLPAP